MFRSHMPSGRFRISLPYAKGRSPDVILSNATHSRFDRRQPVAALDSLQWQHASTRVAPANSAMNVGFFYHPHIRITC